MKIHSGKFIQHPRKPWMVYSARCGKKDVQLHPLASAEPELSKVTCKTCLRLLKNLKCESPL